MSPSIQGLIEELASSIQTLKHTLEAHAIEQLEDDLMRVQTSMQALQALVGGADGLVSSLNQLPSDAGQKLRETLLQAKSDHALCGELIRLAMQRNAALQAHTAQSDPAATYSAQGGFSMLGGGHLLGKI